jgi:toxin FitB
VILLDTDVLPALMREADERAIQRWLDAQPSESVWTSAVTVFEIRFGLELLSPSRRLERLEAAREARLATRNTRHFDGLGVALVDSWGGGRRPPRPPA